PEPKRLPYTTLFRSKKIIFIGYSLPQADFEMRQLLSRMVDKNTEIEVVDYEDPRDSGAKFNSLINNYKQFFGREIKAYGQGASKDRKSTRLNSSHVK